MNKIELQEFVRSYLLNSVKNDNTSHLYRDIIMHIQIWDYTSADIGFNLRRLQDLFQPDPAKAPAPEGLIGAQVASSLMIATVVFSIFLLSPILGLFLVGLYFYLNRPPKKRSSQEICRRRALKNMKQLSEIRYYLERARDILPKENIWYLKHYKNSHNYIATCMWAERDHSEKWAENPKYRSIFRKWNKEHSKKRLTTY